MAERKTLTLEDAHLRFPNFSGKEGLYNAEGTRTFCVDLPEEIVQDLIDDGWNVRYTKIHEEGDIPIPYLPVEARFDNYPPKVYMLTETSRTLLDEDTIEILDVMDIRTIDLIVNASNWSVNGNSGIKAYLKTLVATIEEDFLERKYGLHDDLKVDHG